METNLRRCVHCTAPKRLLGIQRGDKVIVTQGAMKGLQAEVIRRDDNRNAIIINVTILERTVEYPVSADELKKLTS